MSFAEACALIPDGAIRTSGSRALNPAGVAFRVFGAHAAEVEVDVETGAVRVLRVVTSHDVGTRNVERENPYYPYSAKPVGEAPLIGLMPAVRNAVRHALGVGINRLPLTPARSLDALAAESSRPAPALSHVRT